MKMIDIQKQLELFETDVSYSKFIDGKIDRKCLNSRFQKVYVVNSLSEYVRFINLLLLDYYPGKNKNTIRKKFFFRGISNMRELLPTLYREGSRKSNEFEYVSKFEENASLSIGQFNNPIDLAAATQHYGSKTRLLDWSHSPLVATLFSLNRIIGSKKYYGLIFRSYEFSFLMKDLPFDPSGESMSSKYCSMINKIKQIIKQVNKLDSSIKRKICSFSNNASLNSIKNIVFRNKKQQEALSSLLSYSSKVVDNTNPGIKKKEKEQKVIKILKALFDSRKELFIETNYSNERIRNQRGIFQICFDDFDPFKGNCLLLIHPRARGEIIKYINKLGFNFYMLMNEPNEATKVINATIAKSLNFNNLIQYSKGNKKNYLPRKYFKA